MADDKMPSKTQLANVLRWLLPTVAGVAAGILSSLAVSAGSVADSQAGAEPTARLPLVVVEREEPLLSVWADAGARSPDLRGSGMVASDDEAVATQPVTHDELLARQRAAGQLGHSVAVEAHASEAVDWPWAREVEWRLSQVIPVLEESANARSLSTECRSTTCAMEFEWPDYVTAMQDGPGLVHANLPVACGRRLSFYDERMDERPFRATLLVDCADAEQRGLADPQ